MLRRGVLLVFLVCCLTPELFAAEPSLATLALAVRDPDFVSVNRSIMSGLKSSDPAVRALAARLANVRSFNGLVDDLRKALATEISAEAAREEIRALVMLGGAQEIDVALAASARFNHRLDGTVATAAARASIPGILNVYVSKIAPLKVLGDDGNFFRLAFWGRQELIAPAAAIMLARHDEGGWTELLDAMIDSQADLSPDLVRAALACGDGPMIRTTLSYLAKRGTAATYRTEIAAMTSDEIDTSFAIEIARRGVGEGARPDPRWLDFLRTNEALDIVSSRDIRAFLTRDEDDAFSTVGGKSRPVKPAGTKGPVTDAYRPGYAMPSLLPEGVSNAVLEATKCGTGFWVGVAPSTVDAGGRVLSFSSNELHAADECRAAAEVLSRLSLIQNDRFDTPSSMHDVLLVRAQGAPLWLDEPPVPQVAARLHYPQRAGGSISVPYVVHRVDPARTVASVWMARPLQSTSSVVIQAVITREGNVRNVRFVKPSRNPDFNSACALALTQWRFEPARRDGAPVDVVFELTIDLKTS